MSVGARTAAWPPARPAGLVRRAAARLAAVAGLDGLVIGAAALCWAAALAGADLSKMAGYGLLDALPLAWPAALLLLAGGFAVAAARERPRPLVLGLYVVALVVVLHATTALLYAEPRYAWTYKHLGVIDYLMRHGSVDRSIDIYQNWPGFFALNAWLSRVAGISPLAYAGWAELFFDLANVAGIIFALRGLTRDARLQWSAAWLFVVANWIGQDYLSPQALTFFLSLVAIGVVVRCAPLARPPRTRVGWRLVRMTNRLAAGALRGRAPRPRERAEAPLGPRAALAIAAACYVAVVITHQLSPFMLLSTMVLLAAATRRPPVWVIPVMLAVEAWWVGMGFGFISAHFKLLDFHPSVSARTGADAAHALPGVALGADASRATILLVAALALAGLARRLRSGHTDLTAVLLICAPALVIAFQSYGGEGPMRLYLFALPWLAFLAASALRPHPRARHAALRALPLFAATVVVGAGSLLGAFGQETLNRMTTDDVAASRWFLDHAPASASLTLVAPNFPDRLDDGYVNHLDDSPLLVNRPGFRAALVDRVPTTATCDADCMLRRQVEVFMDADRSPRRYLALSPSQEGFLHYYALSRPGAMARLQRALLASPRFTLAYRHGAAAVLRYSAQPGSAPGRRRTAARARR